VNALRQVQIQREWLGYEEARRVVGLSRTTLYRLAKTGEIKGADRAVYEAQPRLPRRVYGASDYQWQRGLTPRSSPPTAPPRSRPVPPAPEHGCSSSTVTQRRPPGPGAAKTR
jgi:hypothetical protein